MTNNAVRYGIVGIAVVLLVMVALAGSASAGDIYIASAEEWGENITNFENMVKGDTIYLTGDIDFSGKDQSNITISYFYGNLDGYGNGVCHTISNSDARLFDGYAGGLICNVTISNFSVLSSAHFNGVFSSGVSSLSRIENVIITDCVVSGNYYVGIMFGSSTGDGVEFVNCMVKNCKVSGNCYIGSLLGAVYPNSGYVTGVCVYDCDILGKGDGVGGLFGDVRGNSLSITDSWVICCDISGVEKVGGIAGYVEDGCTYYDLENCGVENSVVKAGSGLCGGCLGYCGYKGEYVRYVDNCTVGNCVIYSTGGSDPCGGIIGGCVESGTSTVFPDVSNCTVEFCTIAGNNDNPVGGIAGTFPTLGTLNRNQVISSCIVSVSGKAAGICPTAATTS